MILKEPLIHYFPWLLSCVTLFIMYLTGNKNKYVWVFTILNQGLWLFWICATQSWGFLPMNLGLTAISIRNHFSWNKSKGDELVPLVFNSSKPTLLKDRG